MIQSDEIFDDDPILAFIIHPQSDVAIRQAQFCHDLMAIFFEKGVCSCQQEFREVK